MKTNDRDAQMNTWQPISSAPKDRSVLLWAEVEGGDRSAPHGPVIAWWYEGGDDGDIFGEEGGWMVKFTDGGNNCSAERPTHWMDLPTSPEE